MDDKATLTFEAPVWMRDALDALAAKRLTQRSPLIRRAIAEFLAGIQSETLDTLITTDPLEREEEGAP